MWGMEQQQQQQQQRCVTQQLIPAYSHSVVAGGLAVRSYKTRDIPGTVKATSAIFSTTFKSNQIIREINNQVLAVDNIRTVYPLPDEGGARREHPERRS